MLILGVSPFRVLYAGNFIVFITVLYFTTIKIFLNGFDIFKRIFYW